MERPTTTFRRLVAGPELIVAPGCYDGLTATLVAQAGFTAAYLTGAGVSYSLLGKPDLGLVTFSEMVGAAARVAEAAGIPVIADADTGYGNAINVMRTAREYERAGLAAMQLEDQVAPKRCGHMAGKELISAEEMVQKIHAACDARQDPDFVIIARTDARSVLGLPEAIRRARLYGEAGADVIFVESPHSVAELQEIRRSLNLPLLANMVEGGKTPMLSAAELQALGYKIAIFPNAVTRLIAKVALELLEGLRKEGTTQAYWDRMFSWSELNELLGFARLREQEVRYATPPAGGAAR